MSLSEATPRSVAPSMRNTARLIDRARPHFEAAHHAGVMGVFGRSLGGRRVELHTSGQSPHEVVDFVRCAYLGLDNHPAIVAGAIAAIEKYGAVHWSCARTRLNFGLIGDLEDDLSDLFDARVITYSTVLAANMSALPLLASGHLTAGQKPLMVFDRLAHATLAFHKPVVAAETTVTTIAHNDLDALETLCRQHPTVAYICDGVYSMGGAAPISALLELQARYGLFLYVDDAHGISLHGARGQGFARAQIPGGLGSRTLIAASLGKGFGASGGLIMLGTPEQESLFRSFAVAHAFSASPNLAAVGAALASARLHRTPELAHLQNALKVRLAHFDALVPTAQAGQPLPIRTIRVGDAYDAIEAARVILERGAYVSAIFFPTVAQGEAGLRLCPTAAHTVDELEAVADAVRAALAPQLQTTA